MLILSRPAPGCEAQYDDWYQNVHLEQMLSLKGFKAAQRFRLERSLGQRDAYPYAAIYEIETNDLDGVLEELYREAGSQRLMIDVSLDRESVYAAVYGAHGPVRRRKRAPAKRARSRVS
jgi:hypothetical protein